MNLSVFVLKSLKEQIISHKFSQTSNNLIEILSLGGFLAVGMQLAITMPIQGVMFDYFLN